nr:family 78 glycoside hydrolase catalytic domain [Acrocarpospora catenulata]
MGQLPSPRDVANLTAPLLGWQVGAARQTAYQVQVAENADELGVDDVWDSGKVESSASVNLAYGGSALTAAESYLWRVRTWTGNAVSDWSAPARFGTAAGQTWGDSKPIWIAADRTDAGDWTDYSLEGNFRITAQNATIVLRARDASNYLMWQFRGNGVNTLAPHTRAGSTFTQLKSVPLGRTLVTGTTYAFKIEAAGNIITTYLDGAQVDVTTVSSTYASGKIGFRTGLSETNSWDDLKVTSSTGKVLYQNSFSQPSAGFACGTVTDGRLAIGVNQNCVLDASSTDWAFLRGEVDLQAKQIAWATLYATGSSTAPARQFVYKLWLNGSFVGLGPTQPISGETRYDGFDVTRLLRSGETNALGAIAYTTSDKRFQAYLVVEYADRSRQTFGTGPGWTGYNGAGVYPAAGSIGTSFYTAPKENIQSAVFPTGFDQPAYDDSAWVPAEVKSNFADLQATPTAKVKHQLKYPDVVVEKTPGNYFIDYGRTWIGGLSLDLDGQAGRVLDIRFGEALSAPQTVRYAMNTGNNYQDKWTLRAGPQHLETWGMRVFRYVEVLGAPTGLTARTFPALAQVYPYDADGARFSSSDSALNQVWQLSRHTVDATNHNLYVDSWTRERGAYEADSYLQMMANFFVSSDPTLGNYSLDYLLTRRTWPTEWPMYTILAFHDSYLQTGDVEALVRNYDRLKAKLPGGWIEASTGLIRKDTRSDGCTGTDCDIVDWPAGERDGYVFRPYNTVINAIGHQSYLDMADIARAVGKDADATAFTATAARIRAAADDRLFDPVKGAYRDGLNSDGSPVNHYAIQAGVFATAFGLADADQAARTADYIESRGMVCSVYCAAFLIESLYNGDRADAAHALLTSTGLRSWMNMIKLGAGATMEAWDPSLKSNLTYSHPWAASPAYNIPQGMFGIRPTTPGYATLDVRPQPAAVDWAGVRLPTLRGTIGAAHHTTGDRTDIGVSIPGNTVARVFVPGARESGEPVVYLDGIATRATFERGYLRVDDVPAGCHVLSLEPGDAPGQDSRLTDVCPDGYVAPDRTAPIVTVSTDPAVPTGDSGWFTGAVSVSAAAVDERSGVASLEYRVADRDWTAHTEPLAAPEGETTYLFRAHDRAGNISGTQAVTVRRDITPPEITWIGDIADGSAHEFGSVPPALTCTASDGLSGPAGCEVTGYRTEVGTHTLTATAHDVAGNTATRARTYTVRKATTTVAATAAPVNWGTAATVTVNVTASASPVTGSVQLLDGSTVLGSAGLSGGSATFTLPVGLAAGDHTFTVSYTGSGDFAPAQATVVVTVRLPPAWSSSKVYNTGDKVGYQGKVYLATWYTKNQAPGDPYGPWQELAMTLDGRTAWTASRIFNAGDIVIYNGKTFRAGWYTRNQAPGDPNGPWKLVS